MKTTTKKVAAALAVATALAAGGATWGEHVAQAWIRGGGFGGYRAGGFRAASRTTWTPGYGVSRTTVAGGGVRGGYYGGGYYGGYYAHVMPTALIVARPGVVAGVTARGISGAFRYDRATGFAYRFGPAVTALPGGCVATFWQGAGAYACAGTTYTYDVVDGVTTYYPVYS
jgi:hypothetical protein